jgi:hypothetical protein
MRHDYYFWINLEMWHYVLIMIGYELNPLLLRIITNITIDYYYSSYIFVISICTLKYLPLFLQCFEGTNIGWCSNLIA